MPERFIIYQASAGSGKTFVLAKEYLQIALKYPDAFKRILAVTFTNKAAGEMKNRILEMLAEFQAEDISGTKFLIPLLAELKSEKKVLEHKAKQTLSRILHNYSDFSVSTIDSFFQGVVRAFAGDLKLSFDYELEMDTDKLLNEMVDILITSSGLKNPMLTDILLSFIFYKIDEKKSWNVEEDIMNTAKIIFNDDAALPLSTLLKSSMQYQEFFDLSKEIRKKIQTLKNEMHNSSIKATVILNNFDAENFYQKYRGIYGFFINAAKGNIKLNSYSIQNKELRWFKDKTPLSTVESISKVIPELTKLFYEILACHIKIIVLKNLYSNIFSVALIREISSLLEQYKIRNNVMMIHESNQIISDIIAKSDTPFIYEKIGNLYRNFLIDEFQDTSIVQWNNFKPLICDSLSSVSHGNKNLLVGDGKQAIYRWRGGDIEQFSYLCNLQQGVIRNVDDLILAEEYYDLNHGKKPINFRSGENIILFNNDLLDFILKTFEEKNASNITQKIYSSYHQESKPENKGKGYIKVELLEKNDVESFEEVTCRRTLETIKNLTTSGNFQEKDIAVLCRTNNKGSVIANYLMENGVNVVSPDSLKLKSSEEITFIIRYIHYNVYKHYSDEVFLLSFLFRKHKIDFSIAASMMNKKIIEEKLIVLEKKASLKPNEDNYYCLLKDLLKLLDENLLKQQWYAENFNNEKSIDFNKILSYFSHNEQQMEIASKTLFDAVMHIIRSFKLYDEEKGLNVYLQFFVDSVHEYTATNGNDFREFLKWWDDEGVEKSVIIPEETNAVKVMSIHKAKGLQFPVVIFPFATSDDKKNKPTLKWVDFNNLSGFFENNFQFSTLLDLNKLNEFSSIIDSIDISELTDKKMIGSAEILNSIFCEENEKEALDMLNVLYVAITRPEKELYIFSQKVKDSKSNSVTKWLNEYIEFKEQNDHSYMFGNPIEQKFTFSEKKQGVLLNYFQKNNRIVHIRTTNQARLSKKVEKAIDFGILIHRLISEIHSPNDIAMVLNRAKLTHNLPEEEFQKIEKMINALIENEKMKKFFVQNKNSKIFAEKELISINNGKIKSLRPDRMVMAEKNIWLVDFKTGSENPEHHTQVEEYSDALTNMGYKVISYLVYFRDAAVFVKEIA